MHVSRNCPSVARQTCTWNSPVQAPHGNSRNPQKNRSVSFVPFLRFRLSPLPLSCKARDSPLFRRKPSMAPSEDSQKLIRRGRLSATCKENRGPKVLSLFSLSLSASQSSPRPMWSKMFKQALVQHSGEIAKIHVARQPPV